MSTYFTGLVRKNLWTQGIFQGREHSGNSRQEADPRTLQLRAGAAVLTVVTSTVFINNLRVGEVKVRKNRPRAEYIPALVECHPGGHQLPGGREVCQETEPQTQNH